MSTRPTISRGDLHVHPSGNSGDLRTRQSIYAALLHSNLQIAVLADHDRIDAARNLVSHSRDEGATIELLVGEEISTREGHLVGIGLSEIVPPGLSLGETTAAIHDQSGIAVVAHPLLPPYPAASARRLLDLAHGDPRQRPDALETVNPLALWVPGWRRRIERLATRGGYAVVGGSDAHRARSVGRAWTCFQGETADALFTAIQGVRTWGEGQRQPIRDVIRIGRG